MKRFFRLNSNQNRQKKSKISASGQALVEYLIVLALLAFVGVKTVGMIGRYLGEAMGALAHVVSIHLTTGVCGGEQYSCFYSGYKNGKEN
jgi:hypothetical protein